MEPYQIVVTDEAGQQWTVPLPAEGLAIGRAMDNEVVIDQPGVASHHVQVTWDGASYYVTDLSSVSEVYLGEVALPRDEPTLWRPGQRLRLAGVELQLVRAEATAASAETGPLPPAPPSASPAPPLAKRDRGRPVLLLLALGGLLLCLIVLLSAVTAYFFLV